jgi:hypothetical protein
MIDINKVKQTYSQMYDKELQAFATDRMDMISPEIRDILYDEFIKRKLNTDIFENFYKHKLEEEELSGSGQTNEFMYTFWVLALNDLRNGKSKEEIRKTLISKDLSEERIDELFKRIPQKLTSANQSFIQLLEKRIQNQTYDSIFGFLSLTGLGLFILYFGVKLFMFPLILLGILTISWSIYLLKNHYKGELKGPEFWLDILKNEPERIVWIKPIIEKTKVYYVFTLSSVRKFQLLTNDGLKATFSCDTDEEQGTFFNGVKAYLPHAQLGYSIEIETIYKESPKKFIEQVEKNRMYTPYDTFTER